MNADRLLDALGNEHARDVLVAAADSPCSVEELTDRTDASRATVYRQVETLTDLGLLCERRDYADGAHYRTYEAGPETVAVELTPEGFEAVVDLAGDVDDESDSEPDSTTIHSP